MAKTLQRYEMDVDEDAYGQCLVCGAAMAAVRWYDHGDEDLLVAIDGRCSEDFDHNQWEAARANVARAHAARGYCDRC